VYYMEDIEEIKRQPMTIIEESGQVWLQSCMPSEKPWGFAVLLRVYHMVRSRPRKKSIQSKTQAKPELEKATPPSTF